MHIAIDASRANKKEKTGTEWYSWYLIENIKKLDTQNQYFLYSREVLEGELGKLPQNFQERILKWPFKLWTQFRLSAEMLRNVPKVLFVPAHTIPLIHPKKTITTLHDIGFEKFPELYSTLELFYHRWSAKFALKHASKIITISNFTKQEIIKKYKADPNKIVVIHNGYDNKKYRPIDDKEKINQVLAKYNIKKPYFLFIGRLGKKKNVLGILEALLHNMNSRVWNMGDYKLVLAGIKGYGFSEIEEFIIKNSLQNNVIIPGYTNEEDLPYLLNGAESFVFPSFYEGFGIPALEAMASGCPVITSNTSSLPEVCGDSAILVDPNNTEELAQAMAKVAGSEDLKLSLKEKGLERVKKFSWEKCAKETLEVLKNS